MKPGPSRTQRGLTIALLILFIINLAAFGWLARPIMQQPGGWSSNLQGGLVQPVTALATPAPTSSPTPEPILEPTSSISLEGNQSARERLTSEGVLILSLRDGPYSHLFAYHPLFLPLTRITHQPWDDITPAVSPDGARLAYSSRQNGYWDLYVLNLISGEQQRLTDTPDYEASPTWSPDGQWIAYERYNGDSMEVYLQSLTDPDSDPIPLTDDPGTDRSPAWSPLGREIAFVSTRSGDEEIWLARLDNIDDRFVNLSRNPEARDLNPAWSFDGQRLAWASENNGDRRLVTWDDNQPEEFAKPVSEGDRAAWSPDGNILFSEVRDPQQTGLAANYAASGRLAQPLLPLPGALYGMTWIKGPLVGWLAEQIDRADTAPAAALWEPLLTRTVVPAGRKGLIPLQDVAAPQPSLHDAVDEAFQALRQQIAQEAAGIPFPAWKMPMYRLRPRPPHRFRTTGCIPGRAFAVNPLLLNAGWMAITRENFGGQTYWRVFLKARYQDGSMGVPLTDQIWDLNARYSGSPQAYEQGGQPGQNPAGYWIDLTEIAGRYSWERLPSWVNWRTFYPSVRFNQFVIDGGLDWHQAMAELYPPEALRTATSIPTYTPTVNDTPEPTPRPQTATPRPSPTLIPTRRSTWTPLPTHDAP